MKKLFVMLAIYVALGADAAAFHDPGRESWQPSARLYGYGRLWAYLPSYGASQHISAQYIVHRTYYTPYRYAGSQHLSEQSSALPLGWNRYYLAAKTQAPYSLILRNTPAYPSYRPAEPPPARASRPAVTLYRAPSREVVRTPAARRPAQISAGMTQDQVRTQLGQPLVQVDVGEQHSWVYDLLVVEFEQGLVKKVAVR
jgi:hypothetical protein